MVDLEFKSRLAHFVPLALLKFIKDSTYDDLKTFWTPPDDDKSEPNKFYLSEEEVAAIKEMQLLTQGRLSVSAVSDIAYSAILKLGEKGGWGDAQLGAKGRPTKRKPAATQSNEPPKELRASKRRKPAPKKVEESGESDLTELSDDEEPVKPVKKSRRTEKVSK